MKNTKKDFKKFSSRSKDKERAKRELLKMVQETNVDTSRAKIRFTDESGKFNKRDISAAGIFSETASGFGFVRIDGEKDDIFIPESNTGGALGADTVMVKYHRYISSSGEIKTEGRITEILEYGIKTAVGVIENDLVRFHKRRAYQPFFIPDDPRLKRRIPIRDTAYAEDGDKVMVKLVRDGSSFYSIFADVLTNFGKCDSKAANYDAILAECEVEASFTKEETAAADEASAMPIDFDNRVLRNEMIFTIDSESAKDLDDAVSLLKTDVGYTLGVHIADVSHYVKEKTVLDRLVMRRGTSVYFTDKVVPMLPTALSNNACSLNPGEYKHTLSAIIELDNDGKILSTRIEPSIIKSHIKGIYAEINQIFEENAGKDILSKYSECLDTLSLMHELYLILAKKNKKRGAVELLSSEAEIMLNEVGDPVDIVKRERGDAEKMIEQFMLTANEAVATLLLEKNIPCVYRIHEAPPADKLSSFLTYAHNLGLKTHLINSEDCKPIELASVIDEAIERGIGEAVSYACLRSMSKAEYSEIHRAHFGLGIENYCHFTSPIRRLSDLATHRIIHKVLLDGAPSEKFKSYAKRAAAAATAGELRALNAERRIENLYKVIFMSNRIGEIFNATVTSITSFGLFATLDNTCEGLVPISTIEGNYIYDEANISLRNNKSVIRIGDMIKIRVEEADMQRGKLRFSLYTEASN